MKKILLKNKKEIKDFKLFICGILLKKEKIEMVKNNKFVLKFLSFDYIYLEKIKENFFENKNCNSNN